MSAGSLPQSVNVRKAVTNEARYSGTLSGKELPQLSAFLDPENPHINVTVSCGRDEEGRQIAGVQIEGSVVLECQRCLRPVRQELSSESALALVLTDDQAKQLPARYEPWLVADELDLWALAAEEIALALPVVAYHPIEECSAPMASQSNDDQGDSASSGDSPFSVLADLLNEGSGEEK